MINENKRLAKILENDRLTISNEINNLICYDLSNLLENYFNLSGGVSIKIEPTKTKYSILISCLATGVKSFKNIK